MIHNHPLGAAPGAETEGEPRGELAIRTLAMPADSNPNGDIFGGWVMAQMDIAGGITAAFRARGRVATVGVTSMSFHRPVLIGDVVCCYCDIERVGTTSIAGHVEVWVKRGGNAVRRIKVTEGMFTYVAIDDQGRKRPMPPEEAPKGG
ncbi:MAG: acyl-CoA thioesterase [Pseudomonadota bacterium]